MVIGLRILALIIDLAFCLSTLPLVAHGGDWVLSMLGEFSVFLLPFGIVLFFLWPVLCVAVPTGIWGRSLGKLICRLKVTDVRDQTPGLWRALGREVLKFVALATGIGTLLTAFQILQQGTTWYDNLCETKVEFTPYQRLTEVQKNWRRHYNIK